MMSFVYDVIDPCHLLGIPAKYGLIRNSNVKNVPPSFPILYSPPLTFVLPQDKQEKLSKKSFIKKFCNQSNKEHNIIQTA